MTKMFIVRTQHGTGAAYLTARATRSSEGKYRWAKASREVAAVLTEGAARSAAKRYGGTLVQLG